MRGSALLVTLVLLLVITVSGIAGMSATMHHIRMAGNLQDATQVFAATAAALRRCEAHVRSGASSATGRASEAVWQRFVAGLKSTNLRAAAAEYFQPAGLGKRLSAQGASRYQLACLIELNGPVEAARFGGSLRRPRLAGHVVTYTVTASGARVPPGTAERQRPSVMLRSRVVFRR